MQFAERLKAAMIAAGYQARPSVLEKHFNARYWGRSVSYQAVRRWLIGLSIPEQEKLMVLAQWLEVPPHTLRFGAAAATPPPAQPVRRALRAPPSRYVPATPRVSPPDRETIGRFLKLPADERRLVGELVAALSRRARSHDVSAEPAEPPAPPAQPPEPEDE